jgi:hypothetical protein
MYTVQQPPGVNPIAVKNIIYHITYIYIIYRISYRIVSYHVIYHMAYIISYHISYHISLYIIYHYAFVHERKNSGLFWKVLVFNCFFFKSRNLGLKFHDLEIAYAWKVFVVRRRERARQNRRAVRAFRNLLTLVVLPLHALHMGAVLGQLLLIHN